MIASPHLADAFEIWETSFCSALQPKERLTVWEWADKYRMLSAKDSAEPGPYRSDRTPYLKEIMFELSNHSPVKKVVFKKGAQVGATAAGLNWLGYIVDHDPGMTMVVWPTLPDAKKNSKIRLDPLISATPRLREKIETGNNRDSKNTGLFKDFENGALIVSGANSASSLSSIPAKNIFGDEIDRWPDNVEGEGDPVELVEARQATYSRKKAYYVSTPTFKRSSKIHREWLSSDQRWYYVPCPHCDHYQILGHEDWERPLTAFDHLRYETKVDASGQQIVTSASLFCKNTNCGAEILEHNKPIMFAKGEWRKHNPESEVAGFMLSSLYSPLGWMSWKDICQKYVRALNSKDPEKMITFVNLQLGEVYEDVGERPVEQKLFARREQYPIGTVQRGAVFLTCAVDVQADRIEAEVQAWGRNRQRWSVERKILIGDTKDDDVWDELEDYITTTFNHVDGWAMPIMKVVVDSGYETQKVYNFCRKFDPRRVIPIKGEETLSQMYAMPKAVDVSENGKTKRRGVKLWKVGTNMIKAELYGDLQKEAPEDITQDLPAGYIHFPDYDLEYFSQLVAEERRLKKNTKGHTVIEWHKIRDRNETLDLYVYNRAAAAMIGIDRWKEEEWKKAESNIMVVKNLKRPENGNNNAKTKQPKKSRADSDGYW
jgi:phage terminase large subunit GpA-like protein